MTQSQSSGEQSCRSVICQRDVDIIGPEETVLTAAERMRQRTVGCLVVVEKGRLPIGIVTDRDLVLRVVAKDGMLARLLSAR